MLNIKEKPQGLLLFAATVLLICLVLPPLAQLDFQDKTMFAVPLATIVWLIPLLLIFVWLLYLLTKKFLYSTTVTWIHVLITISATILIVIVMYIGINPLQPVSHSYNDTSSLDRQELIGNAMQILFIVFVLGQFLFPANLFIGYFSKNKK